MAVISKSFGDTKEISMTYLIPNAWSHYAVFDANAPFKNIVAPEQRACQQKAASFAHFLGVKNDTLLLPRGTPIDQFASDYLGLETSHTDFIWWQEKKTGAAQTTPILSHQCIPIELRFFQSGFCP